MEAQPRKQHGFSESSSEQATRPQRTQIMTLREGAKYLGVHEVTMYRLIKETDIPALKLRGQWRFKKDLLDAWLISRMQRPKRSGSR